VISYDRGREDAISTARCKLHELKRAALRIINKMQGGVADDYDRGYIAALDELIERTREREGES
jgi:hypothetical protein